MASRATIGATNGLLSVYSVLESSGIHMLNAGKDNVAVSADGALATLGDILSDVSATRSSDGLHLVASGSVRVSAGESYTVIVSHF